MIGYIKYIVQHRVNNFIEDKETQIVFGWKFHELRILRTYQCDRSHLGFQVNMKQKIFKIHNKFCIVLFVFFKEIEKKTLTLTKFTMKKKLPVQTAPKNTRNGQTIFFSQFFVQF